MVASICVCSLTVSEDSPSATAGTWWMSLVRPEPAGYVLMLTPKFTAIWTVLVVVARCSRSVKAVFEDCASAFCTLVSERLSPFGPTGVPMASPPSFSILSAPGSLQPVLCPGSSYTAAGIASEYDIGSVSPDTQRNSLEFSMLFETFMPSDTAVASTYGLNDDPTCSRVRVVFSLQS
jgi:hypothetical protein